MPSNHGHSMERNAAGSYVNQGYEGNGVRKVRESVATPMDNMVDEIDVNDFILEVDQPNRQSHEVNMEDGRLYGTGASNSQVSAATVALLSSFGEQDFVQKWFIK